MHAGTFERKETKNMIFFKPRFHATARLIYIHKIIFFALAVERKTFLSMKSKCSCINVDPPASRFHKIDIFHLSLGILSQNIDVSVEMKAQILKFNQG